MDCLKLSLLVPKARKYPDSEESSPAAAPPLRLYPAILEPLRVYLTKIQEEMAAIAVDALTTRLVKRRLSQRWALYKNIYMKNGSPNNYRIEKEIDIIVNTEDMYRSKAWNETSVSPPAPALPRTPPHCPAFSPSHPWSQVQSLEKCMHRVNNWKESTRVKQELRQKLLNLEPEVDSD